MLPAQVTLIPIYILFSNLHWVNTFLPLTLPAFFGNAAYIFLLRQFFLSGAREVSEAARLDGAGELGIYWSMVLPLALPALVTVAILMATATYNDFFGPLIYLTDSDKWTLALGLYGFIGIARLRHRCPDGGHGLLCAAGDRAVPGRSARVPAGHRAPGGGRL